MGFLPDMLGIGSALAQQAQSQLANNQAQYNAQIGLGGLGSLRGLAQPGGVIRAEDLRPGIKFNADGTVCGNAAGAKEKWIVPNEARRAFHEKLREEIEAWLPKLQ